ncbi:MAG: DUF3189 family protein [Clostridia bacterium]|nr:DUF3189 family protein [Clostridia bacterium]
MSIVFLCPTGTYASLVAANLLVGNLDLNCNSQDIYNLPYFGEFTKKPGTFLYIGAYGAGTKVYTLGTGSEAQLIIKSAYDLVKIIDINPQNLKLYDVSRFIPKFLWRLHILDNVFPFFYKKLIARWLKGKLSEIDNMLKQSMIKQVP